MAKYVIVGNGVAGTNAAKAIRETDKNSEITIYSRENYPFYSRPRLPSFLSGEIGENVLFVYPQSWYEKNNIKLVLNKTVLSINPAIREILLAGGGSAVYDKLILANGSLPSFPQIAGLENSWVFSLRTIEDAKKIRDYSRGKKSVIAIGGGLLGLEAGNGLRKLGLEVKVIEFFDRLLPRQMDKEGSVILQNMFEKLGFTFVLGAVTEKIFEEGGKRLIKLKDGRTFSSDFVLVSAGIKPDTELAKTAGLKLNKGIIVDDFLRTSDPDIYAAGDVAEHNGRIYGIWPAADEQGRLAGLNMAGKESTYHGTVLSTTLKIVGVDFASLGDITGEGAKERKIIDKDKNIYNKIFVKDNKIAGAILLGDIKKAFDIQLVIKNGINVSGYEEKILRPDFDLKELRNKPVA